MFNKNSYVSSLIILSLIIILIINLTSGIIINKYVKEYKKFDSTIFHLLSQIKGEIQRYSKFILQNKNPKQLEIRIDNNIKKIFYLLEKNNEIIPTEDKKEFKNLLFSLIKNWKRVKEGDPKASEDVWVITSKLTNYMQQISQKKIKYLSKKVYAITFISSLIIIILIFFVYARIKEGIEKASISDNLTGLYNRLYFDEMSKYFIEKYKRYKTPFTMLLFDIDDFKKINDTYGHQIGDDVLRKVGNILLDSLRRTDIAFRYGGEEFVVILPQTSIENSKKVVDRLRALIAREINFNGKPVTISGGIAQYNGEELEKFIKKLDDALYEAKRSGKNKIIFL